MSKQVLIVDDDLDIRTIVEASLSAEGFDVTTASDGEEALEKLQTGEFELVVLDVVMPGISGTELCKRVRSTSNVPIIFLSGRSEDIDRIIGLEIGADDYLTKPFNPRELVARVKAILRRADATGEIAIPNDAVLETGKLKLDREQFKAFWSDEELELTKTEFLLLRTMVRHPGRVYSRSELMTGAYEDDVHVSDRTIDSHIRRLRHKLLEVGADPIKTVRGVGYKIDAS